MLILYSGRLYEWPRSLKYSLMSVLEVVSDEGSDEIYTYYETCQCQLYLINQRL